MSDEHAIKLLNELLDAEGASLVCRLGELSPAVTYQWARARALVEQLVARQKAHQQQLAEMILALRGAPHPPRPPIISTGLHYVDLASPAPAVLTDLRKLAEAYRSAQTTGHPPSDGLIARLRSDREDSLCAWERVLAETTK